MVAAIVYGRNYAVKSKFFNIQKVVVVSQDVEFQAIAHKFLTHKYLGYSLPFLSLSEVEEELLHHPSKKHEEKKQADDDDIENNPKVVKRQQTSDSTISVPQKLSVYKIASQSFMLTFLIIFHLN